tara:strand:+ start:279 stop:1382 length:1104 start_codon:yes stop_codon:yes gene_type:complete
MRYVLIEDWPFSFRFSIAENWGDPNVAIQVWIGIAILVIAAGVVLLSKSLKWNKMLQVGIPLALLMGSLAVALPPLAVDAYPETFRKIPIPFDAHSIANGSKLYAENCVTCHGHQGKGNGILSRTLTTFLPDMLTEQHVEEHTPGDFYHWISYGMKDTDMSGFADKLSEADRWDLVNFFHALSRGYRSRILTTEIVPNKPYVASPSFSYTAHNGKSSTMQNSINKKVMLLVIFSWPQSQARLEQLKQAHGNLSGKDLTVLIVPKDGVAAKEIARFASDFPFPLVIQNASEITSSYALFRRTLSHPDLFGKGVIPDHMEFLIDRYGYLRARWIPLEGKLGWENLDMLTQQITQLNQEKEILPPEVYVR